MPEIPNEIALVAIWGLVQIIQQIIGLWRGTAKDDAEADANAARERQQWMQMQRQMLETVLASNSTRYQAFTDKVVTRFDDVVEQIQTNFDTALTALVQQITTTMMPITEQREQKLEQMHSDIKTVPGEVWRLGDPKLAGLQGSIRADLEPLIAGLREAFDDGFKRIEDGVQARLESMGEQISPALRAMIQQELNQYHRKTQQQIDNVMLLLTALREDMEHRERSDSDTRSGVSFETPDKDNARTATGAEQPKTDSTEAKKEGTS